MFRPIEEDRSIDSRKTFRKVKIVLVVFVAIIRSNEKLRVVYRSSSTEERQWKRDDSSKSTIAKRSRWRLLDRGREAFELLQLGIEVFCVLDR